MDNKNVYLDVGSRRKDVWIGIDRSKKELTFSVAKGGGSGYAKALIDTTENWNLKPTFIPDKGLFIVYIDHGMIIREGETVNVPGIKIGDGAAYLIDLPFIGEDWYGVLEEHIQNTDIHVNPDEKSFWNAKLNCDLQDETLQFNRN